MNNPLIRIPVHALVVWLLPFIVSLGFFTPEGELRTDIFLFKTVMILVSTPLGLYLMTEHLRGQVGSLAGSGLLAGAVWMLLNWILDFVVLLPLSGMAIPDYFTQIGLRYFIMPITGYFLGRAMTKNATQPKAEL